MVISRATCVIGDHGSSVVVATTGESSRRMIFGCTQLFCCYGVYIQKEFSCRW